MLTQVREVIDVEADRTFRGSIPALYDQHLGPLIFAPYADDLASRLADMRHGRILGTLRLSASGNTSRVVLSDGSTNRLWQEVIHGRTDNSLR